MSTKLQPMNSKLSVRNKKIRELLDETKITALEISADDAIKFAMFFIGFIFLLHVITSLIPSLPTNVLISICSGVFAVVLSVFVFKLV